MLVCSIRIELKKSVPFMAHHTHSWHPSVALPGDPRYSVVLLQSHVCQNQRYGVLVRGSNFSMEGSTVEAHAVGKSWGANGR